MGRSTANSMGSEDGFTLVELLVVILVVGVLSTLAIPSFLNQRVKGQDACAKAAVKQMHTAIETLRTENIAGSFAGATEQSLAVVDSSIADALCGTGTTVSVGSVGTAGACSDAAATATNFCLAATSVSGTSFALVQVGSVQPAVLTRSCSAPGDGACRANGDW